MTIKLMTVYAGDYKNGLFGGKKDLLVSSQIKMPHLSGKGARSVNQIYPNVAERVAMAPGAGNEGTPIIYHSPSFVADGLAVAVEFKFDNFNPTILNQIGKVFGDAAGLPIFAPSAGGFLLAGTSLKVIGPVLNSIFDKGPSWLKFNFNVAFKEGGLNALKAGFHIIANESDKDEFSDFEPEVSKDLSNLCRLKRKGTGDGTGKAAEYYNGPRPYGIISIDGTTNELLEGFSGAVASAEILEQFFGVRAKEAINEDIKAVLTISNDYFYDQQIQKLQKELKKETEGSDKHKELVKKIEAYQKNLQTEAFGNLHKQNKAD